MTKISEIVSINTQAVLSNAIQLSWYYAPSKREENNRLVSGYVFGNKLNRRVGAHTESSSLPVFEKIRDAFGNPQASNIFTVIANYGHGKSHFALVLANYFGLRSDSPVIADMIQHIETCSDKATADHFRNYKKQTSKPHLVVAITGTEFQDLRQGFLQALRRALDSHEETRNTPIKSLSSKAVEWIRSLDADQIARADKFLDKKFQTDLESLCVALENFESGKEIVLKALSEEILGIAADFGADANLKEVVKDVVDTLCSGKDAPFHRLIVLFDELGVYAEKWCHKPAAAGGLAPQEIFEACSDRRGKICFVGFVQRELGEFVKGYPAEVQSEFLRWAGRMLPDALYLLVSNLEEVISKLIIKKPRWTEVIAQIAPRLVDESSLARESIQRYNHTWEATAFYNVVTRDCFPLHPLTTGILCSFDFTQGSRTIIGAVGSMLSNAGDRQVTENGVVRWIHPVELVQEFESSFRQKDSREFAAYEHAVASSLTTDAEPILFDVLKALFLFKEVRMTKQNKYHHAEILAPLAGYSVEDTKEALRRLQNDFDAVRYSIQKKEYEFTGIGSSRVVVLDMARQAIVGKSVHGLARTLEKLDGFKTLIPPDSEAREFKAEYAVEGDEWYLASHYIDAVKLSADEVRRLCKMTSDDGKARGAVINLISGSAAELDEARSNAETVMSELKEEGFRYPFLIGVPREPSTQLEKSVLLKDYLLHGMSQPQKVQFADSHRAALDHINKEIDEELIAHIRSVEYVLSDSLRLKFGDQRKTLDEIADALFAEAYSLRAPANTAIIKPTATTANSATAEIAKQLIVDDLHFSGLNTQKQNIVKQVLVEGVNKWGILNANHKIREPKDARVKEAWSFLNKSVTKDNWTTFASLISKLSHPPFGYDEYTVTFLLAAWIGKHKHELAFKDHRISANRLGDKQNRTNVALGDLQANLNKSKDFIKYLRANVAVQHSGAAVQATAKDYLQQIQNVKDTSEAEQMLVQANRILQTLAPNDPLIAQINDALTDLSNWVKGTKSLEKSLAEYRQVIAQSEDLPRLVKTQVKLNEFGVRNDWQSTGAFVETMRLVEAKIDAVANTLSRAQLSRIEAYDALKERLESARHALHQANRLDLESLLASAMQRLDSDYSRLQAEAREVPVCNELNAVKLEGMPLNYLQDQLLRIEAIIGEPISSKTQRLAESRKEQVGKEIERLSAFSNSLASRVDRVKGLAEAEALQAEILRSEYLYRETSDLERISNELERLERLVSRLKEDEAKARTEAEAKRKLEIEKLSARNISAEYRKIRDADQRFACLLDMLSSNDGVEFSVEQKERLRARLS